MIYWVNNSPKMRLLLIFTTLFLSFNLFDGLHAQTQAPDSLGLPGDNLNLYGVLELFKNSPTLELFEEGLNRQDSYVNNLDLNNDDMVDYIKVIDLIENNAHTIVLQVLVNDVESQDVAAIEIERNEIGNITLQIVGDETLYGSAYVIETQPEGGILNITGNTIPKTAPKFGVFQYYSVPDPVAPTATLDVSTGTPIEHGEGYWPILSYIYGAQYNRYLSSWRFNAYPHWWIQRPTTSWQSHREQLLGLKQKHQLWFHFPANVRNGMAHQLYMQFRVQSAIVAEYKTNRVYAKTYQNNAIPAVKEESRLNANNTPAKTAQGKSQKSVVKKNIGNVKK